MSFLAIEDDWTSQPPSDVLPLPGFVGSGLVPNLQRGIGSKGCGVYGQWKTGYDGGTGVACDKFSCPSVSDFTLLAVFDGSTTGSVLTSIIGGDDTGNRQFQFRLTASNTLEFIRFNTAASNVSVSVAAATRKGVFIGRSKGLKFRCWANGVASSEGTMTGTPQPVTKIALNGKWTYDAQPQVGDAIYHGGIILRALSDGEIASLVANPWQVFQP